MSASAESVVTESAVADAAVAAEVTAALGRLDLPALRAAYEAQGEFAVVPAGWLPAPLVARLAAEAEALRWAIHRAYIPRRKKSGSVSYFTLRTHAPGIVTLYRLPAFLRFLEALTGRPLQRCPERDPHACALYWYAEPGDHIAAHFDDSFYRAERFTVLLGLVNRTQSRLGCQLHRRDPRRAPVDLALATEPGLLVVFNGETLWHWVTPLGPGEERICLTMQYVVSQAMHPFKRFVSDMKDAISYFGFREVFGRRAAARRAS